MRTYNNIGISADLDWKRIKQLFVIGLTASIIVFISDMLMGYGLSDPSLNGLEKMLSSYVTLSDSRIFWSATLGVVGISVEGLCYFGVYRLIASRSEKYAHIYRTGIFGYLMFAACGVHVPCLAAVYFYKSMLQANPAIALEKSIKYGLYFMAPGFILFEIFFLILCISQIIAFWKRLTPYPRWCWIFSILVPMLVTLTFDFFPENALLNGLSAAWISLGNIWMFGGLLVTMKKAKQ